MIGITSLRNATNTQLDGAKAATLSKLLQAGFMVPDGFVIEPSLLINTKTSDSILKRFDRLSTPYVAVRSSGNSEDSVAATWAGQLDSYLNVARSGLLQAILDCRHSINAPRAKSYADQRHLEASHISVLVQEMVMSESSGVAFSVHPVTRATDQVVIEAGLGLGEAIVSGEITPDTYVIAKQNGALIEKNIAMQSKMLIRNDSGGNIWKNLESAFSDQKLTYEQIHEILNLVQKVASYYSFPVDIEWAYASETLYLLQSRPVTAIL